ncbi:Phosphofurin acidic cluster sorting protein 1, partial [Ophiophagus hannah]
MSFTVERIHSLLSLFLFQPHRPLHLSAFNFGPRQGRLCHPPVLPLNDQRLGCGGWPTHVKHFPVGLFGTKPA